MQVSQNNLPSGGDNNPPSEKIAGQVPAPASAVAAPIQQESLKEEINPKKERKKAPRAKGKGVKQIPTILGLLILIASLTAGVLFFGSGTGVFAPRAAPETTPKNIKVTNVTDKSFAISFYTDEATPGFVQYGDSAANTKQQSSDDRDQLSGVVKSYKLHHITVRGLEAGKDYYYKLGTGSNTFDKDGQAYIVKTAIKPTVSPISNQTIYGVVNLSAGTPAEGAIVYLYNDKMGVLSTLVKESGSFGLSLSNAFTPDGAAYAQLQETDPLQIKVQGIEVNLLSTWQGTIAESQPVPDIILGEKSSISSTDESSESAVIDKDELLKGTETEIDQVDPLDVEEASLSAEKPATESVQQNPSLLGGESSEMLSPSSERLIDLSAAVEGQDASQITVKTEQPQIKATLPANTMVKIEIHSDALIEQTLQTDENGELILDIESLGKNLEPGEHSATYTYIDPNTGEEVSKIYHFTVLADTTDSGSTTEVERLAMATATPTSAIPYGSGNPYLPSPSPSTVVTPTISSAPTPTATVSSRSAVIATSSGVYNSGSVENTFLLIIAGIFFVGTGIWSFHISEKSRS